MSRLGRRSFIRGASAGLATAAVAPRRLFAQSVSAYNWLSPRQFGTLGTSDDSAVIQAAFTAAAAAGCGVEFPPGNFYCNNISVPGLVSYRGAGRYLTTLTNNHLTNSTLTYAGGRIRGTNIGFSASVSKLGGTFVDMGTVGNNTLDNFYMELYWVGIANSGTIVDIRNGAMLNSVHTNPGTGGSGGILVGNAGTPFAGQISNVLMSNSGGVNQAGFGIKVLNSGDLVIDRCNIIAHGYDLMMNPSSGNQIDSLWATNTFFDTAANGITIQPSSGGFVGRCRFDSCWTSSHSGNGVSIGNLGGTVSGVQFISHHAFANTSGTGLAVSTGATDISVIGGVFAGNIDGIGIFPNVTDFTITGTSCGQYDGFSGNTAWGIAVSTGSSDRYIITNNRLTGNTTAGLTDGGSGSNKNVSGNIT